MVVKGRIALIQPSLSNLRPPPIISAGEVQRSRASAAIASSSSPPEGAGSLGLRTYGVKHHTN